MMVPDRSFHHGVAALVAASATAMEKLSGAGRAEIDDEALGEAMWDLRHRQVLVPLIDAFADAGVPAVLLKGTALAYSFYASPALRQRGDTDILVPPELAETARKIIATNGFLRSVDSTLGPGTETNRQESWIKTVGDGTEHAIDLHWGVMHAWSLAGLLDTSAVIERSVPLPNLCSAARRICTVDALYHACLHRGVHIKNPYYVGDEEITGGDRLIWIYDVHLLVPHLSEADWDEFVTGATQDKTADLCLDALIRAGELFGSDVPGRVLEVLGQSIVPDGPSFLLSKASEGRRFWANLAAIPGLLGKVNFVRFLLFPSQIYMRQRYPELSHRPVVMLYLRRVLDRLHRLLS